MQRCNNVGIIRIGVTIRIMHKKWGICGSKFHHFNGGIVTNKIVNVSFVGSNRFAGSPEPTPRLITFAERTRSESNKAGQPFEFAERLKGDQLRTGAVFFIGITANATGNVRKSILRICAKKKGSKKILLPNNNARTHARKRARTHANYLIESLCQ